MPIDTKHDPFKPAQPAIPGVPAADPNRKKAAAPRPAPVSASPAAARPAPPPAADRSSQMLAIGICLIACVLITGLAIVWVLHKPAQPVDSASSHQVPDASAELAASAKPSVHFPVAPGVIATEDELAKPWASKNFIYRDPLTNTDVPALVVRLPRGGYWGFSMTEPFGTCDLEYVTNLERLQTVYGFRADHPMVADPCNHEVFDLLQYGGPPSAEVRGAPVHGTGVRPPLAIEIEQQGKNILAVKME